MRRLGRRELTIGHHERHSTGEGFGEHLVRLIRAANAPLAGLANVAHQLRPEGRTSLPAILLQHQ